MYAWRISFSFLMGDYGGKNENYDDVYVVVSLPESRHMLYILVVVLVQQMRLVSVVVDLPCRWPPAVVVIVAAVGLVTFVSLYEL
jgi:hypothetical protein